MSGLNNSDENLTQVIAGQSLKPALNPSTGDLTSMRRNRNTVETIDRNPPAQVDALARPFAVAGFQVNH